MKLLRVFLFTFLIYLSGGQLFAASYNYPYVCSSPQPHLCFRTETGQINVSDSGFFLSNTEIRNIPNFRNFMNIQTNILRNYYGNTRLTILGYYQDDDEEVTNRQLTLTQLLNISDGFHRAEESDDEIIILRSYISGRDYLYSNFTTIINELHAQGFPMGDRRNQLHQLLPNIFNYDHATKSFRIRNICQNSNCHSSSPFLVDHLDDSSLTLLNGTIRYNSDFVLDVFRVSDDYTLSTLMLVAGNDVTFNFGFEDYLDVGSQLTRYSYTVYYGYDGGEAQALFTEIISVDQNYNISSDTIEENILNDMIEIEVLSDVFKKIRIGIREGVQLTRFGNVTFFLSAENLNTGDIFPVTAINPNIPLQVIPSNSLGSAEATIIGFTNDTNNAGYNVGDTFSVIMHLFDEFGNRHYDAIEGYDISLVDGTSSAIELSKQGSEEYFDVLTGVTSSQFSPYTLSFKFRITEPGFHVFEGFNIQSRYKNSNSSYLQPAQFSDLVVIPENLFHNGQKLNLYIKSPLVTDFPISCTNQTITLEAVCTSDNFSGCNPLMNQSITFTTEADNGSIGSLSIRDYAHNVRNFNYVMNHIDQTPPTIRIFRGLDEIISDTYSFRANADPLNINFFEATTSNCDAEINYTVSINGEVQQESSISASNFDLEISDFFRQSGENILQITASDKYGNTSEKIITFTVHPDLISMTHTDLDYNQPDTRYADFNDFYIYTLTLRDQFHNPIMGKSISGLTQDCTDYSGCQRIINNVSGNIATAPSSLQVYDISGPSDENGRITFRLRSRAPGVFTNVFGFNLQDWNDQNINIGPAVRRYVSSDTSNSFNRLFIGSLDVSEDGGGSWTAIPSYGTELDYRLNVTSSTGLNGLSAQVISFSNSIRAYDEESSFVEGISNIVGLNTKSPRFSARINASGTSDIFGVPGIKLANQNNESDVMIRYVLAGTNIITYLSESDTAADRTPISISNETDDIFLGVEIIGLLQGLGNTVITGQEANISNIATSEVRNQIRRNAVTQTRGLQSGQIVNGVRFVQGDVTLSGQISGYETLVVQNGNVIINGDLNTNQQTFGIIVLSDNYNVDTGYLSAGNIYIHPNVSEIYAAIYADGALVSVNTSGIPYSSDSSVRNSDLRNQLYLKGSLFTRNTIGGGILSDGMYTLPGGRRIPGNDSNFTRALSYDLNYIRRGRNNCIEDSPGVCRFTRGAFVIENDPSFRINPPRLF